MVPVGVASSDHGFATRDPLEEQVPLAWVDQSDCIAAVQIWLKIVLVFARTKTQGLTHRLLRRHRHPLDREDTLSGNFQRSV